MHQPSDPSVSPIESPNAGYWRSLAEYADSPEIQEKLANEFQDYDPDELRRMSRRGFMKYAAAGMALAGMTLSGCRRWPKEVLAPYSAMPRDRVPGVPEYYASIHEYGGVGRPVLVSSFDGRPIKLEGNPEHPMTATAGGRWGASGTITQASILDLYDPDRSKNVIDRSGPQARRASFAEFEQAFADAKSTGQVAVLAEHTSSPTARRLLAELEASGVEVYRYEPLSRWQETEAAKAAFGVAGRPMLKLDQADVIVSFDDDFLGLHPAAIRYAGDWAKSRRAVDETGTMSRTYVAETTLTNTGAAADVREPANPAKLVAMINALTTALDGGTVSGLDEYATKFVKSAAKDLKAAGARGVVTAGAHLPVDVQAACMALNAKIGSVGTTITLLYVPEDALPPSPEEIVELAGKLSAGEINGLVILGGNPAYDAPAELAFRDLLISVPFTAHLSQDDNETSGVCKWHLPRAHYLECWGDALAYDGTPSVQQPLILPLYNGMSMVQTLGMLLGQDLGDGMAAVAQTWAQTWGLDKKAWQKVLHDGLRPLAGFATANAVPQNVPAPAMPEPQGMALRFVQHDTIYDGTHANNGWLQEAPDPLTKLTWDNALLMSLADAREVLGIDPGRYKTDDAPMANVTVNGTTVKLPVYLLPGQPRGCVSVAVGFGRTRAGNIGGLTAANVSPVGFDVYPLRSAGNFYLADAVVEPTSDTHVLDSTQEHYIVGDVKQYGKNKRLGTIGKPGKVLREATLADFQKNKYAPHKGQHGGVALQLWEPPNQFNTPHAWGMSIDMNACVGCNACVIACQSENNIPVVGKEGVHMNREMHWLRVDRYFKTKWTDDKKTNLDPDAERPEVTHQPMMCVHCENAPCEQVCPVAATVHDTEGLNTMVYNRCIGTRYCSNNCPYKVRRFNYLDWHYKDPRKGTLSALYPWLPDQQQGDAIDAVQRMVMNPDVSVRMRGVMEKCTYCTQRIQAVTINKRNEWAKGNADSEIVDDMEIITACQQACPTQAIVFGDLNQADQTVTKNQRKPRAYGVLEELNTRPRTKYLAVIRNKPEEDKSEGGSEKTDVEQA
ncbi:MAG: TAT-variant-translocated molybdopterin oxidoreductase [Planctomycetota bacterium]